MANFLGTIFRIFIKILQNDFARQPFEASSHLYFIIISFIHLLVYTIFTRKEKLNKLHKNN